MLLTLRVRAFRNLALQEIAFGSDLVLVTGANAQGKSSLLEAVYQLATTRSFRSRDPREAITHGEDALEIGGEISQAGSPSVSLSIGRARGRGIRRLCVGQYIVKLEEYLEYLPALVMTGESTRSIAGSPSERRRYMDRATASALPGHLPDLAEYRKALAQRNQLLRQEGSDEELDPWDRVLASVGERIAARREEQIRAWQELLPQWLDLFPEGRASHLFYRRALPRSMNSEQGASTEKASLAEGLARARMSDRRTRVTSVGPHRDDLGIEVQERDLWRFGSAGQVRSSVLAITLAQARRVRQLRPNAEPVLILDDVDSDLDKTRFDALLMAARKEGQTFAATSKPSLTKGLLARKLSVEDGNILSDDESGSATGRP